MTDDELVGAIIDGTFRIEAKLGEGGMGSVYRATDLNLEREVALKVIRRDQQCEEFSERFLAEARALASLSHPGLATIYALGLHEGRPFMALELIPGLTLWEILLCGPLEVPRAMKIALQALSALELVHHNGIIHRDLKPANLMVIPGSDRVKLLDFGLAKRPSEARKHLTDPNIILGTPPYISPEMIKGATLDARSDLYAMGVIIHEMLAGGPPFPPGDVHRLISDHLRTPPPPLRSVRPDVPAGVEAAVLRALAKKPAERFGDARELADALRSAQVSVAPVLAS